MDFLVTINVLGFLGNQALDYSNVEKPLRDPTAQTTRGKRVAMKCSRFLGIFLLTRLKPLEKKLIYGMLLLLLLLSRLSRVQLYVTPIDSSPPGSSAPGILQARILECVAFAFSNA